MCGISRNEFDRGGNVFYDHVTNDHCMYGIRHTGRFKNEKLRAEIPIAYNSRDGRLSFVAGQTGSSQWMPTNKAIFYAYRGRRKADVVALHTHTHTDTGPGYRSPYNSQFLQVELCAGAGIPE